MATPKIDQREPIPILRWFTWEHLTPEFQAESKACAALALEIAKSVDDGAELRAGLRHLLEAKDCFVRAGIQTRERREREALA